MTSLAAIRSVRIGGAHLHQLFRMCCADEKRPAPQRAPMAVDRIKNVAVLWRYLEIWMTLSLIICVRYQPQR